MRSFQIICFLCIYSAFTACSIEHAEEQILAYHAGGEKKTSIWVYPDGEILKRNEWFPNGIKELEIPYKNNMPHGDFRQWTPYGDVILKGSYKNGLRNGKWISTFIDKKVEAYRYYKEDHPIGDWEGFHHNGVKAFEEHYSDKGDTIGVWEKWYENGTIAERNNCHHLDSIGFIEEYYENGKRKQFTACSFGILNGEHAVYAADNHNTPILEEYYENGVLNGNRTFYLPSADGHIPYKREHWIDGVRDSIWHWSDEHGNLIRESSFTNGTGIAYGHCENNLSVICAETSFVESILGGLLDSVLGLDKNAPHATLWYFKKGHNLRYEEIWTGGEIRESRSFYPDSLGGKKASEGFWSNNKRHGIWRNWYSNGILMDSLTYVNGERVGEQYGFDSTGTMTIHKTEAGKNKPIIMHLN